jgi:uncharacterized protein (TIGR00369 family)
MMSPLTPADIQSQIDRSPFGQYLALEVRSCDPDRGELSAVVRMRPDFERGAGSGQWHGGPIAAIIDTVGDYAVVMMTRGGVPTMNIRIDYLRPAINTDLRATALVRKLGKSIAVVDIDVCDASQRLIAVGRGTYGTSTRGMPS